MFWGCFGYVRASHPTKKCQNKTPGVFLHAEFDFKAPAPWNTAQKSKNKQKTTFKKIKFSKIDKKLIWTYEPVQFFMQNSNPDPKLVKTWFKNRFWPFFENFQIFENFENYRKSQGGGIGRKASSIAFPNYLQFPLVPPAKLPTKFHLNYH